MITLALVGDDPDDLLPDEDVVRQIVRSPYARHWHQWFVAGEPRPGKARAEEELGLAAIITRFTAHDSQAVRILECSELVHGWDAETRRNRVAAGNHRRKDGGVREYLLGTVETSRSPTALPWVRPGDEAQPHWTLYTADDLRRLPEPPWLVHDVLFAGGFTLLYGMKGTYKSFVAHSLAEHVGRGGAWFGNRAVTPGTVVYVVAEGKGYFARRIRAAGECSGVRYVTVPVNLFAGQSDAFAATVRAQLGSDRPVLFVFDTLARSMVGGKENDNSDMMVVVDAAQRLQQEFNAAVLLVHHTGKDGLSERGGSALRAAADIVVKLEKTGPLTVNLLFENTKDLAEPDPLGLRLEEREQSLVVTQGEVLASAATARRETPEERCTQVVTLCAERRTKEDLARATARTARSLERDLRALVRDGRLKVASGEGTRGSPFVYLSTGAPIDTV